MNAFIGSYGTKISLANLAQFPSFVRFNKVDLQYRIGSQSLRAKCLLFEECLESIKLALKGSNEISFVAKIKENNPSHFSDHSRVVIYIRDRLLPFCDSSRRYEFAIGFKSDEDSTTALISSILQISQVQRCSNISISLLCNSLQLPVEDISNWLAPKTDYGVEIYGKKKENRFLQIHSNNTKEMWEHLKEV